MGQKRFVLKIYSLAHPLMTTEWRSILGDKYCHALPFDYEITDSLKEASVIAWDGIISLKQRRNLPEIETQLRKGKVLLMLGESQTLFQDHSLVSIFSSASDISTIRLTGWSVLPEEILAAFEACYQKIIHV
jgi:hypothetical protein